MAEDEQQGSGAGKWLPPTDRDEDEQGETTLPGVPGSFSGGPDAPGSRPAGGGLSSGDPLAGPASGDPLGGETPPPRSAEPAGSSGLWSGSGSDPGQGQGSSSGWEQPSSSGGAWGPPPSQGSGQWGPPPSQQQSYAPYGQPTPTNNKAIASLILGIAGLVICPLVCSVLAIVFGHQGRGDIDRSGGREGGRGLATAGIVLGWIGIVLTVLFIVFIVVGVVATDGIFDTTEFESDGIGRPSVILGL